MAESDGSNPLLRSRLDERVAGIARHELNALGLENAGNVFAAVNSPSPAISSYLLGRGHSTFFARFLRPIAQVGANL